MHPGDMNEPQRRILADLSERNAEALEILRQGVTRPYFWIQYEAYANAPLPEVPPRLAAGLERSWDISWAFGRVITARAPGYRRLAQVFRAAIAWRASKGDITGALDDCLVLMDFGMHLEGRGTEAEQLVGMAIEGLGNSAAFTLLDSYDVVGFGSGCAFKVVSSVSLPGTNPLSMSQEAEPYGSRWWSERSPTMAEGMVAFLKKGFHWRLATGKTAWPRSGSFITPTDER